MFHGTYIIWYLGFLVLRFTGTYISQYVWHQYCPIHVFTDIHIYLYLCSLYPYFLVFMFIRRYFYHYLCYSAPRFSGYVPEYFCLCVTWYPYFLVLMFPGTLISCYPCSPILMFPRRYFQVLNVDQMITF